MNSKPKLPEIRNGAFTKAREKLGLNIKNLASQACLSKRQIEQIENGEMSSFYGAQIKLTAAKKVAKLLGLSEEEAFNHGDSVAELAKEMRATPEGPSKVVVAQIKQNQEPEQKQNIKVTQVKPAFTFSTTGVSRLKQTPKKGYFIWLSLIAVVVFSIVNLRPLFFANKPEEILVVKEEVIEQSVADEKVAEPLIAVNPTTTPPPALAPAQTGDNLAASSEACPAADAVIPGYKPSAPKKPADLVYVQAKTKQVVCVVDASGKTQNKTIDPNLGASFYGTPPFKVLSSGLAQVDVYFQGAKVRPANLDGKTILLEAGDISQPAAPTDSGFR